MTDIPTREPEKITAGDYVKWKREYSDCVDPYGDECKASAGWELTYALVNGDSLIAITAATSTDDYLVTLSAATTAAYAAGTYHWQAYVTKSATSERYRIESGTIEILPNFASQSSGYDDRSHAKKVLDALEARLENRATKDQAAMVVSGMEIAYMPIHRVLEWRDKYKVEYQGILHAQGLGESRKILVRFTND